MSPLPRRRHLATAVLTLASLSAAAQSVPPGPPPAPPAPAAEPAQPSAMTAELFYEVLLGELNARDGDPVEGFQLLLDSARRTREPALFQRAVDVAVRARSPEAALVAVRAWKQAIPDAREPRRLELQILILLGRLTETVDPLRADLAATPVPERPAALASAVRAYSRASNKQAAAQAFEQSLSDELKAGAPSAGLAWAAVGRLRLNAADTAGALAAAQQGNAADPKADAPAVLALELMDPSRPDAEALVRRYLSQEDALPEARVAYARALALGQRYDEATAQMETLTRSRPDLPDPWLLLGSLQAQVHQDAAAQTSLQRYLDLATRQSDADERARGIAQAYLQLAQLAERRKDFAAAEQYLSRVEGDEDMASAQLRRAMLLAKQGKVAEARQIVRSMPARTDADRRQQLQAEAQVLREAKMNQAVYDLLAAASAQAPNDADLLYDLAMAAEKLNRVDETERLLRRVIALKPDNANAYNALGYSLADRSIRLPEARQLIRKAVELSPNDPFIADSLGWVEFRLGNMAEAQRILEGAYKTRPDPEIGAHLGEVLWAQGQRDRALSIWREASMADAENETLQATLRRLRVKL
ncbi:tetratricopeptide repeat protein [Pseudacidovorax intermedius]|uniref:tetratricopeptide repeat protein n=1 Tax=Pseudacidovorax intermedius TaxID=433924 RepID=UPI0005B7AD50